MDIKFLTPTKRVRELQLSVVCIDPAVLSTLSDTPATIAQSYGKGIDPRQVIRRYEDALQKKQGYGRDLKGVGVFMVTETGNFVFATLNENGNIYQTIDALIELVETYTSEYYLPVSVIEKPIPQNPMLCMTAGAIAGALYFYTAKPIWCNPINWKRREKEHLKRFLSYYGVDADVNQFTPHEIDACLLYAYTFEGYRPFNQKPNGKEKSGEKSGEKSEERKEQK